MLFKLVSFSTPVRTLPTCTASGSCSPWQSSTSSVWCCSHPIRNRVPSKTLLLCGIYCFFSTIIVLISKHLRCFSSHPVSSFFHLHPSDIEFCISSCVFRNRLSNYRRLISLAYLHIFVLGTLDKCLTVCEIFYQSCYYHRCLSISSLSFYRDSFLFMNLMKRWMINYLKNLRNFWSCFLISLSVFFPFWISFTSYVSYPFCVFYSSDFTYFCFQI